MLSKPRESQACLTLTALTLLLLRNQKGGLLSGKGKCWTETRQLKEAEGQRTWGQFAEASPAWSVHKIAKDKVGGPWGHLSSNVSLLDNVLCILFWIWQKGFGEGGVVPVFQERETKCFRLGIIWRSGPTLRPSFSLPSVPRFCIQILWLFTLPCLLPQAEPHLPREATESPLESGKLS